MRHSFFGVSGLEDLSAEIVLTPLEAIEGTTIPIGIPVRQTCPGCGGRGETWQEWCDACGGCGDVRAFHDVELRVPAGRSRRRAHSILGHAARRPAHARRRGHQHPEASVTSHVKLLGILQIVWGAIGLVLGVSTLMLAIGAVAVGMTSAGREIPAGVTAVAFGVFAAALLAAGAGNAWAGSAIHRRHAPGRLAALGLAVPNLFVLPFGTALGIYALWVLLHDESRRMFVKEVEARS